MSIILLEMKTFLSFAILIFQQRFSGNVNSTVSIPFSRLLDENKHDLQVKRFKHLRLRYCALFPSYMYATWLISLREPLSLKIFSCAREIVSFTSIRLSATACVSYFAVILSNGLFCKVLLLSSSTECACALKIAKLQRRERPSTPLRHNFSPLLQNTSFSNPIVQRNISKKKKEKIDVIISVMDEKFDKFSSCNLSIKSTKSHFTLTLVTIWLDETCDLPIN